VVVVAESAVGPPHFIGPLEVLWRRRKRRRCCWFCGLLLWRRRWLRRWRRMRVV